MRNNHSVVSAVLVVFMGGCSPYDGLPQFRTVSDETTTVGGIEQENESTADSGSQELWSPYTYSDPDSRCPLAEMVYISGSGGPFTWGADWNASTDADLYNWMFSHEYSGVEAYCILRAPFPTWPGSQYFNDGDSKHGNSYGDTRSVRDSQVLADLGLRLPTFREAAWFQKQIENDGINLDQCTMGGVGADGMFAHPECTTSLGVEIGPYALWATYDNETRAAHTASIEELSVAQANSYHGPPNEALEFLLSGWGGGTVCPTRSSFCVHHHVVQYGALWDGPMNGDEPYDPPGDPYQTLPGNCWQDDGYLLISAPGAPNPDLQATFWELERRYAASDHNKAVLWDPVVGL